MATLSDLTLAVSHVTKLPAAAVFAYGRFAREKGLISQAGRGRAAASVTDRDAANLLIAVLGTGVTREAAETIKTFRQLKGRAYNFGGYAHAFERWLKPLGLKRTKGNSVANFELQENFGAVIEFLMASTIDGSLSQAFSDIPVTEFPIGLWRKWKSTNNQLLDLSIDRLVELGHLKTKPRHELNFGEDFSLEIKVSRITPAVEIEFVRMWDAQQVVFALQFGPLRGAQTKGGHVLRLEATITQHVLAGAALVVRNMIKPAALSSDKPLDLFFADQFARHAVGGGIGPAQ